MFSKYIPECRHCKDDFGLAECLGNIKLDEASVIGVNLDSGGNVALMVD